MLSGRSESISYQPTSGISLRRTDPAEGVGDQLGAEADPEHWRRLVRQPPERARPLARRGSDTWSQYTDQSEPSRSTRSTPSSSGQPWCLFAMPRLDREAVLFEPGADEAGVGVVRRCRPAGRARQLPYGSSWTSSRSVPNNSARARAAIAGVAKHTPVTSSAALSDRVGGTIVLKAENLQRTGSFKIRGALAKLAELGEAARQRRDRRAAPATTPRRSRSRHATTASRARSSCPAGASIAKTEACRGYGASVVMGGASLDDAVVTARERAAAAGLAFCHPVRRPGGRRRAGDARARSCSRTSPTSAG